MMFPYSKNYVVDALNRMPAVYLQRGEQITQKIRPQQLPQRERQILAARNGIFPPSSLRRVR
jgi:hypothetical protein